MEKTTKEKTTIDKTTMDKTTFIGNKEKLTYKYGNPKRFWLWAAQSSNHECVKNMDHLSNNVFKTKADFKFFLCTIAFNVPVDVT